MGSINNALVARKIKLSKFSDIVAFRLAVVLPISALLLTEVMHVLSKSFKRCCPWLPHHEYDKNLEYDLSRPVWID